MAYRAAPLLSIGLPVFNGQTYIRDALDSILGQTFADFIVIISDNASTDNTEEICRQYAAIDSRISYIRHSCNHGPIANHAFVLRQCQTKYFMWASADDLLRPTFIEKLLPIIESDSTICCVMCDVDNIFGDAREVAFTMTLDDIRYERVTSDWSKTQRRFFLNPTSSIFFCVYGIFKTYSLRKVELNYKNYLIYSSASEIPILAQLALRGKICSFPEALKIYRRHPQSIYHTEQATLTQLNKLRGYLNVSRVLLDIASQSDLTLYSKACIYLNLLTSALRTVSSSLTHFNWSYLVAAQKKLVKSKIKFLINSLGWDLHRLQAAEMQFEPLKASIKEAFFIIDYLQANVIYDIGANAGQFALGIRSAGFLGRIVSFEPLTEAHQQLMNAAVNDPDWLVHPRTAVGDFDGEAKINIAGNSESSSILPMLESHSSAAECSAYIGEETASVIRLDSTIDKYLDYDSRLFIKIDTQGYEWQVLDGAKETLKRAVGVILELSMVPLYGGQKLWRETIDRMEVEGFVLWAVQQVFTDPRSGRVLQVDATFIRLVSPRRQISA